MPIVTRTLTEKDLQNIPELTPQRIKEIQEVEIDDSDFDDEMLKNAIENGRVSFVKAGENPHLEEMKKFAEAKNEKQVEKIPDTTDTEKIHLDVEVNSQVAEVGKTDRKLLERMAAKLLNGWVKGEISLQKRV